MVEIAAGQGVTLTTEDVHGFLLLMDDEEEFNGHWVVLFRDGSGASGERRCFLICLMDWVKSPRLVG